jgi:U3 small nucleolar ribonucleoprotein component
MEKQVGSKKGTISPQQISNDDKTLINQMKDKLNSKFSVNHESYEIIALSSMTGEQTSTKGSTKYFHLRGKPGNKEYTVTMTCPSSSTDKTQPMITESAMGLKPHKEGFSTQEAQH